MDVLTVGKVWRAWRHLTRDTSLDRTVGGAAVSQVWQRDGHPGDSGRLTRVEHCMTMYNSCTQSGIMLFMLWDRWHRLAIVILWSVQSSFLLTWPPVGMKAAQLGLIPGCDMSQAEQLVPLINIVKHSVTEVSALLMPSHWGDFPQGDPNLTPTQPYCNIQSSHSTTKCVYKCVFQK